MTDASAVKLHYETFKGEVEQNVPNPSPVNKTFASSKHGRDVFKYFDGLRSTPDREKVKLLMKGVDEGKKDRKLCKLLKEYSPFLGSFCQSGHFEEVSVFGQFDNTDAEPRDVVKISGFQQV